LDGRDLTGTSAGVQEPQCIPSALTIIPPRLFSIRTSALDRRRNSDTVSRPAEGDGVPVG